MTKCQWCGKEFTKQHNRTMYCSDQCRQHARQEQNRTHQWNYQRKYNKGKTKIHDYNWYKNNLGTGSLPQHRHENFELEQEKIILEKKRLKIF